VLSVAHSRDTQGLCAVHAGGVVASAFCPAGGQIRLPGSHQVHGFILAFYPAQLPGPVRRVFWKLAYQAMAKTWQRADWRTMNYGFAQADDDTTVPPMPPLSDADEPDRYCFGLYHRVAAQRDLTDLDVLEVGSGRGGGASYVHRYLGPKSTVGLDRSKAAVDLATGREDVGGLSYMVGDAEDLPFEDASIDVVLNVESCHCYGSVPRFLEEVFRILRPGGALLLADLRLSHLQAKFDEELKASPFEVTHRADITDSVVRSLVADTPRRQQLMADSSGPMLRPVMKWFSGVQGSATFRDLQSRRFVYHCYELSKPPVARAEPARSA